MTPPIVVGVDPLRHDPEAAVLAALLARATGAPVVAVAVYPHEIPLRFGGGGAFQDEVRGTALARLSAIEAAFHGVRLETLAVAGSSAAHVLHDCAEDCGAGLLVVGSTHHGITGRISLGSTADRLLHGAPCPIAVAPLGFAERMCGLERIGAAFVDSEEGYEALRAAGALASACGAELHAATAVEPVAWSAHEPRAAVRRAEPTSTSCAAGPRCACTARSADWSPAVPSRRRGARQPPSHRARAAQPRRRPARLRLARLRPARQRAARRRLAPADPPRRLPRDRRAARHRARDRGAHRRGDHRGGRPCLSTALTSRASVRRARGSSSPAAVSRRSRRCSRCATSSASRCRSRCSRRSAASSTARRPWPSRSASAVPRRSTSPRSHATRARSCGAEPSTRSSPHATSPSRAARSCPTTSSSSPSARCRRPPCQAPSRSAVPPRRAEVAAILDRVERRELRRLVFAVPAESTWSLPVYELAMMAAVDLRDRGVTDATLGIVTPEPEPLRLFGAAAGVAMREMLDARGISLWTGVRPLGLRDGLLDVEPGPPLRADAVISVPALTGPGLVGLPASARGFIPVDAHGRVAGVPDVYAAGDATDVPGQAGRPRHPAGRRSRRGDRRRPRHRARPGSVPARCCAGCCSPAARRCTSAPSSSGDQEPTARRLRGEVSGRALWWPPGKVAGRYLAPYLGTARPVDLGSEPLHDRAAAAGASPAADRDEAYQLALLLAEQDAELGDYRQALHALDAAAALAGRRAARRLGREPRALATRAGAAALAASALRPMGENPQ